MVLLEDARLCTSHACYRQAYLGLHIRDGGTVWTSAKAGVPCPGATVDRFRSLQNAVHAWSVNAGMSVD